MKMGTRGGFTLVELSLSMAFIGILSVMMVLLIQNTTASYRRGLVLNQVNTVGMDLIDDMRTSIQNASTDSLPKLCERIFGHGNDSACLSDNGNSFVSVTKIGSVTINNSEDLLDLPLYGAFCTGTYTYIWNSGYFESTAYDNRVVTPGISPVILKVRNSSTGDESTTALNSDFRLLKIYDRSRTVCVNANRVQNNGAYVAADNRPGTEYQSRVPNVFFIDDSMLPTGRFNTNKEVGMELLKKNSYNSLVLYDLYMSTPAMSRTRKNLFFAGSFILGTKQGGINIKAAGNNCKPPNEDLSEFEYCAINKFNFAVEAGG